MKLLLLTLSLFFLYFNVATASKIIEVDFIGKKKRSNEVVYLSRGEVQIQLSQTLKALRGHYFFDYEIPDQFENYEKHKRKWLLKFNPKNFEMYRSRKISQLAQEVYAEILRLTRTLEDNFIFINGSLEYYVDHPLLLSIKQFERYKMESFWQYLSIRDVSPLQLNHVKIFDYLKKRGLQSVYHYLDQRDSFNSYFRLVLQLEEISFYEYLPKFLGYGDLAHKYLAFLKKQIHYIFSNEHLLEIAKNEDVQKILHHYRRTIEFISYSDEHIEFLIEQKKLVNSDFFGPHPWSKHLDDIIVEIFAFRPDFERSIKSETLRFHIKTLKLFSIPRKICQYLFTALDFKNF